MFVKDDCKKEIHLDCKISQCIGFNRVLYKYCWADENLRILSDVSNGEQELGGARSGSRRWREVAREEAIALERARHEQPVEDAP